MIRKAAELVSQMVEWKARQWVEQRADSKVALRAEPTESLKVET